MDGMEQMGVTGMERAVLTSGLLFRAVFCLSGAGVEVQRGAEDAQVGGELATDERISLVHALGSRCEDVTLSMSPSTLHSPPHIGSISTVEESALTFRGLEPPGLPLHSSARESWQSGARPRTPGGECPRTTFRGKRETVVGGEEVGEVGTKVITVDIT